MSYDIELRRRAIEYWENGHSKKETAEVFQVSHFTLQTWKLQLKETGQLKPKKRKEIWRKIEPKKLKEYVEQHPDAFLKEIAEQFGCTEPAIFYALQRVKISRKKNDSLSGK